MTTRFTGTNTLFVKTFVMTKHTFCSDKHVFVMTKVLSQQNYVCHDKNLLWQKFCHDKNVAYLSRQKTNICHDKNDNCGSQLQPMIDVHLNFHTARPTLVSSLLLYVHTDRICTITEGGGAGTSTSVQVISVQLLRDLRLFLIVLHFLSGTARSLPLRQSLDQSHTHVSRSGKTSLTETSLLQVQ